jgi:hypothetical protein
MSICILCQNPYETRDTIMEQRLVADTEFCNICFTEFMIEEFEFDSNILSNITGQTSF